MASRTPNPFTDTGSGNTAYWRDVGTVDSYYEANMELLAVTPPLNLYDQTWPIWTYQEQLPPAKFVFDDPDRRGVALNSMVSGGCIVAGARLWRSLLFSNVRVESHAEVEESVILPNVDIGPYSRIRRAIIDKGCILPEHTTIGFDREADARRFHVTAGGLTLVTPDMLGQPLHTGE